MKATLFIYDSNEDLVAVLERTVVSREEAKELAEHIENDSTYEIPGYNREDEISVGYTVENEPADDFVKALEALSESYETDERSRKFVDKLCSTYGLPSLDEIAVKAGELL